MTRMLFLGLALPGALLAQTPYLTGRLPQRHSIAEPNAQTTDCITPVKLLGFKRRVDLGPALPEWRLVDADQPWQVLEGLVLPVGGDRGAHVAEGDFPLYHYTHDFCFNVVPDAWPDGRYTNLLPYRPGKDGRLEPQRRHMHVEWETGLAAANPGNPAASANLRGQSAGFFSEGHTGGKALWAWPSDGDWVHLEGQWVWDLGHPPADTEIHPIHLCATRRSKPALVQLADGRRVWATRVDVFASADGHALWNNRPDAPPFVQRVPMRDRDYRFCIDQLLPPPAAGTRLEVVEQRRPGDSFRHAILTAAVLDGRDGRHQPHVEFTIPWHITDTPDTAVFARTYYLYWLGSPSEPPCNLFEVELTELHLAKRLQPWPQKAEWRFFADLAGQWYFLNDCIAPDAPLTQGLGRSRRRTWPLNVKAVVALPDTGHLRVHVGGWEADGMDRLFGHIAVDPWNGCTPEASAEMAEMLVNWKPVAQHGCEDDPMGRIDLWLPAQNLGESLSLNPTSPGGRFDEHCPLARRQNRKAFRIRCRIRRLKPEAYAPDFVQSYP